MRKSVFITLLMLWCTGAWAGSSTVPWAFPLAAADDYFQILQCSEYGHAVPCQATTAGIGTHYTNSRNTPETCNSQEGILTYAPSGLSCITNLGMASWEASTNLVTYSQQIAGTNWTAGGVSTLNVSSPLAPDGTATATSYNNNGLTSPNGALSTNNISVSSSNTYTFSFWAQLGTATTDVNYAVYDVTNSVYLVSSTSYVSQLSVGSWTRVHVIFSTGSTTASVRAYVFLNGTTSSGTIFFWGAQIESATFPTPYIPTTSITASRAADEITVNSGSVMYSALKVTPGSFFLQTNNCNYANYIARMFQFSGGEGMAYNNNTQGYFSGSSGAFYPGSPSGSSMSTRNKFGVEYNGATTRAQWGNQSSASGTDTRATATGTITLGDSGGGNRQINGYIERLAVFPYLYQLPATAF